MRNSTWLSIQYWQVDVKPLVPKGIVQKLILNCNGAREEVACNDVNQQENDAGQESLACMSLPSINWLGQVKSLKVLAINELAIIPKGYARTRQQSWEKERSSPRIPAM